MESIPYETGIQQQDNMAPLLFLFVMQAVIQMLKDALPTNKPEYRYFPNDKGRLRGQRTKSAGTPFNIPNFYLLMMAHLSSKLLKTPKKQPKSFLTILPSSSKCTLE